MCDDNQPQNTPTDIEWNAFLETAVPVHQELFNRIVRLYPRTQSGLLDSAQGPGGRVHLETEMYLLRNIAEFPITVQRNTPHTPMLTARFRANIQLIIDTIIPLLSPIQNSEDVVTSISCPPHDAAPEVNLDHIPTLYLWAAEIVRLRSRLLRRVK
ncbi:hypothetical protein VNI00_008960 [Paramarasmius palmivorus]|uniref:Uncharacterized protein n=1 Tax=Paramarasmius palmivorus TaxID=297713 RepID=A0AAW0CSL1_9AGAR